MITSSLYPGDVSLLEPRSQNPRQPRQTVWHSTPGPSKQDPQLILQYRVLYEFHRNENAKKPQSVHATYVISGFQNPQPTTTNGHSNDEDEVMQSSPYMPSSMPNQEPVSHTSRITSIILAREEDLDGRRSHFDSPSQQSLIAI